MNQDSITAAFSPCPNDTHLFYAWVDQQIDNSSLTIIPTYGSIDQLNQWCSEATYDLCKISLIHFPKVADQYILLPIGMAFGSGFGPKLITNKVLNLEQLSTKKIALPGKGTMAEFLVHHLLGPCSQTEYIRFDEIIAAIVTHTVDCGVIIHESRFSFEQKGLIEQVDLGCLWQKRYALPLPLGGLVMKRSLPMEVQKKIIENLSGSLHFIQKDPLQGKEYILIKAKEKSWEMAQQHINLYVSSDTEQVSPAGIQALQKLFNLIDYKAAIAEWLFTL